MITGYSRPQLLIRQILARQTDPVTRTLNAFTLGPQFDLFRYTNPLERAAMKGVLFAENTDPDPTKRQLIPYEGLKSNHIVDQLFTKLFAENLEGQMWSPKSHVLDTDTNLYDFKIPTLDEASKIRVIRRGAIIQANFTSYQSTFNFISSATILFGGSGYDPLTSFDFPVTGSATGSGAAVRLTTDINGVVTSAVVISGGSGYSSNVVFEAPSTSGANVGIDDATLVSELHGRQIKSGDIIYAKLGSQTVRRTVKRVDKESVASHVGTDVAKKNKKFAAGNGNPIQTNSAAFGSVTAPLNWEVLLNRTSILSTKMTNIGSGYTSVPTVVATNQQTIGGDIVWPADPATLTAVLASDGSVSSISVDNGGSGYYLGGVIGVSITNQGSSYSAASPPEVQVSAPPAGGEKAVVTVVVAADGRISSYKIVKPGVGYTAPPTLTVVGGSPGSGATMVAIVNAGSIKGFTISPGSGYAVVPTFTPGGGSGGSGFAVGGTLMKASATPAISTAGTGYQLNDVLSLSTGTSRVKVSVKVTGVNGSGGVTAITLVDAGLYSVLPSAPSNVTGGSGSGAQLTVNWGVGAIIITNAGTGYTVAPTLTPSGGTATAVALLALAVGISITGGGGTNAAATPIIQSKPEDWVGLVEGSRYNGQYAERYTLTVIKGGSGNDEARVRIRSASGGFSAESVPATHYTYGYRVFHPALGGIAIELRHTDESQPLKLGDQFSFVVTGKYRPLELSATGQVLALNILTGGTGYTNISNTPIGLSAPPTGGTQATATITISGGIITSYAITNPGSGYVVPPVVALPDVSIIGTPSVPAYLTTTISTPENSEDIALVQSSLYTGSADTTYQLRVVKGSSLGATQNSFIGATLEVSDSNGIDAILKHESVSQGVQYALGTHGLKFTLPANLVSPSGLSSGSQATAANAVLSGNTVASIAVSTGGSGYVTPPLVTIGGNGTGAFATANVVNGVVQSITVVSAGSGYSGSVPVTIDAPVTFQGGLRTGDVYYINAAAKANTGPASIIVLNGQAADTSSWAVEDLDINRFDLDIRTLFSGVVDPKRNHAPEKDVEAGTNAVGGILLRNTLAIKLTDRDADYQWVPVKNSDFGRLFAHWRGLVPATSSDKIKLYQSEADIVTAFGIDDLDNPACHAAIIAFRGAQEKPVFVAKLATNDLAGYTTVLRQAERIDGIVTIAPATLDLEVAKLGRTHCQKVSAEDHKLWRRCYVGVQNPGQYSVMVTDKDNNVYEAKVVATGVSAANVRVICPGGDFITKNIRSGDEFRTNYAFDEWDEMVYETYKVLTVLENDELLLETGPASSIDPAKKFEVWRPDDGLTQSEFVGDRSASFEYLKLLNCWVDSPTQTDGDGVVHAVPQYYVAAELAGLRTAALPQQGLTYTEIEHSIDDASLMFTKYSQEELNIAAAKGTFIITQENDDGPIFIRHQLTTDTDNGSLYYEDSVGYNLDTISYAFKDLFQPYIGKRNATPETLEEIETKARDLADGFKKNPGGFSLIGPQIVDYTGLVVTIDPVFKDRINLKIRLELPLPINTMLIVLEATTIQNDTVVTTTLVEA